MSIWSADMDHCGLVQDRSRLARRHLLWPAIPPFQASD